MKPSLQEDERLLALQQEMRVDRHLDPYRPADKPKVKPLDQPGWQMVALYEQGLTYREIGQRYGVSRTLVESLMAPLLTKDVRQIHDFHRHNRRELERWPTYIAIHRLGLQGLDLGAIVQRLGVEPALVDAAFQALSPEQRRVRRSVVAKATLPGSTLADAVDAVSEAARLDGSQDLIGKRYERIRLEGGYDWPTLGAICRKWGWVATKRLAGLHPTHPSANNRRFSLEEMRSAVRRVAEIVQGLPTQARYNELRLPHEPSATGIRSRMSREDKPWWQIMREWLPQYAPNVDI